ncbi:MAG: bifunctional riboflavin kinase/FAD synthetase [Gemmatimonadota bacterium]|nr:bifunctional riboflavin kinase/FAD synthetase [Gemmatimonadota bacterium]
MTAAARIIRDGAHLPPEVQGAAVTVGTFDGVHRGHLDLITRLVQSARTMGLHSVAITFEPHPLEIVNPGAAPPLLTVGEEKLAVLAETDLDHIVVLPFTHDLATLDATEFVDRVLRDRFRMKHLLIGHDHGFGRQRAGNAAVLKSLGESRGFSVGVVDAVADDAGRWVSSTAIRRAVAGGDLSRANELLGRPYSIAGHVVPGAARGRALGFPTLNLSTPSPRKLLPPDGVYAVRVLTDRGLAGGMMNLGPRPTFGEHDRAIEAYLFDVSGDFYGQDIRVDVLERLRDTQRFESPDALVRQIRRDESDARAALTVAPSASNLKG